MSAWVCRCRQACAGRIVVSAERAIDAREDVSTATARICGSIPSFPDPVFPDFRPHSGSSTETGMTWLGIILVRAFGPDAERVGYARLSFSALILADLQQSR
jgi:hypothetical protein